jgi:hypothetical protein
MAHVSFLASYGLIFIIGLVTDTMKKTEQLWTYIIRNSTSNSNYTATVVEVEISGPNDYLLFETFILPPTSNMQALLDKSVRNTIKTFVYQERARKNLKPLSGLRRTITVVL